MGVTLKVSMRYNRVLLGTPETRRRGRSTLKALRAFMSNPPPFSSGTPAILLMVSKAKVKRLQETITNTYSEVCTVDLRQTMDIRIATDVPQVLLGVVE